ncbi:MAG: hypothetical protein K2W99_02855 [Chthoniobacterales bacterium]|nr:hypothetical protein [Chthoniobacterales bacterium]
MNTLQFSNNTTPSPSPTSIGSESTRSKANSVPLSYSEKGSSPKEGGFFTNLFRPVSRPDLSGLRASLKIFVVDAVPGAEAHSEGVYSQYSMERAPKRRRNEQLENFYIHFQDML